MSSEKKVHILYVLTKLELGGAQKVCLSLIDGIKKDGGFGGLISGDQGVLVDQVKKNDSVYLLDSFKREVSFRSLFFELKAFAQMILRMRKLKKEHPEIIVHTHSTKAGILGRWAAFFAGIKKRIHTVHGFGFHDYQNKISWFLIYFLEYITCFVTTHYVCVSESDQKIGSKLLPRFKGKSSVIRAAVDWDKFYIPAVSIKETQNFVIGTTSCFKPQKNLIDMLKAFKLACFTNENLLLQIIGDGVLRPDIQAWIIKNKMEKRIELLGWQDDVSKWMKNWDLFVMSSLWEGLPCAIVEARLSKLPVISYDIAGIHEVIKDGINGFLVAAGDWQALSQKIDLVVRDKDLHGRMQAYKDDLNRFHNKAMVREHLDLYRKLV